MSFRRRAAALASAVVLLSVSLSMAGCTILQRDKEKDESRPNPGRPAVQVDVQAPDPLKTLLETHLDLSRLRITRDEEAPRDVELARLVAATKTQAQELIDTAGHFSAHIEVQREPTPEGALPRVRVTVDPGPQATVGRVTVEVQGEIESLAAANTAGARSLRDAVQAEWALKPGQAFTNDAWSDAKNAALARLRGAGYATASWTGTGAEVDAQANTVRLFVVADSGPLFRTGELRIRGLERIDEAPVRALAGFKPGTPATDALLLDYQERLQKSGLFEGAAVTIDPDVETAAAAPVIVRLREKELQELTTGLGISANTGPRISLEHQNRQLLGRPFTARNKLEWGQLKQAWEGEISTYPGEKFYRHLVGGAYTREESSDDIVTSSRVRLGRTQDTTRIDRLIFGEVEHANVETDTTRESATAYSANYHLVWRDVDSVVLPTDGATWSGQGGAGWAVSNNGKSGPFARLYSRYTFYRPLGEKWFGQARVELGQVFRQPGVNVPETLQFRAGGEGSVRGYEYRSLGPEVDGATTGGNVLFTGSIEIARPILERLPSVWGAVFLDAGQAATRWQELDLVYGAGFGVRWRSPLGPLSLDLAYGEAVRNWRLHLSVGIVF